MTAIKQPRIRASIKRYGDEWEIEVRDNWGVTLCSCKDSEDAAKAYAERTVRLETGLRLSEWQERPDGVTEAVVA